MKVGIMLPLGETEDVGSWARIRELAELAESEGLDSLWVADHFFYKLTNNGGSDVGNVVTESYDVVAGNRNAFGRSDVGGRRRARERRGTGRVLTGNDGKCHRGEWNKSLH